MPEKQDKKLEDILRLIELCKMVQSSSVNPFEVDIREKLLVLKKHLPDWKVIDIMLMDSEALHQLVQIVKLQDQWIKYRASALYIDPLLLELKIRLLTREDLADSFVKCWHPVAQVDQLTARGLEKAFTYWRDLTPLSERFKEEFGNFSTMPGQMDFEELKSLNIFTTEQFETELNRLFEELRTRAPTGEMDYREFIKGSKFEETAVKAYMLAFLITEGRANVRVDPLTEQIFLSPVTAKPGDETKSVAIEVR
ncbi:MAG: hypothetical protein OK456_04440 [Thaumarchaeota archaeon]|nr:hypothetical protein [Nitrososphaerota archaeon]